MKLFFLAAFAAVAVQASQFTNTTTTQTCSCSVAAIERSCPKQMDDVVRSCQSQLHRSRLLILCPAPLQLHRPRSPLLPLHLPRLDSRPSPQLPNYNSSHYRQYLKYHDIPPDQHPDQPLSSLPPHKSTHASQRRNLRRSTKEPVSRQPNLLHRPQQPQIRVRILHRRAMQHEQPLSS